MKLLKPRTFIIFALAGLSGAVLLHTSQNVQHAEERLRSMELSVYREQEKVRMLRAEWEALNNPERLERLAHEFLDLVPPTPEQMLSERQGLPDVQAPETFPGADESDFAPVLQPVTYAPADAAKQEKAAAPIPPAKPVTESLPPSKADEQKDFKSLMDSLGQGGAQ